MADELCPMSPTTDEHIIKKPKISHDNLFNDPTLQLPDHVLHSIFSYLISQDLVHALLVSKRWHQNSPSIFVFDFDESLFRKKNSPVPSGYKYVDRVHSTLETSKNKLAKAEKRILRGQFYDHKNVDDVMKLMTENNFHEVYLRFEICSDLLPRMFRSTCLTLLHLTNCSFDDPRILRGEENFDSLQELKLNGVMLTGGTLSLFVSKCPNIRQLSLVDCKFLGSIILPKLRHLKKLYVEFFSFFFPSITSILVNAPSLQIFHFVSRRRSNSPVYMDIHACRMLQEFHLDCLKFPVGLDPEKFGSNFPHLETLLIGPCETSTPIKISSLFLKKLILFFTRMYDNSRTHVVIAPNLCTYEYIGTTFKPFLNPRHTPNLSEIKIGLAYNVEKINRAWFLKLRSHLKGFRNNTVLSLCIRDEEETSPTQDKGKNVWSKLIGGAKTHPLHHIKHVVLDMNEIKYSQHKCSMKFIINSLFWMSHPDTLTLSVPYPLTTVANEVYEELVYRREGNCCSGLDKCWRHFLDDFKVDKKLMSENKRSKFVFKFTWLCIS